MSRRGHFRTLLVKPVIYYIQTRRANMIPVVLHQKHASRAGTSNYIPRACLLNRLFGRRSKKTSKTRVTGLCAGNSPVTGEFPAQMASNAENVSIWWRHHAKRLHQLDLQYHSMWTTHINTLSMMFIHWQFGRISHFYCYNSQCSSPV